MRAVTVACLLSSAVALADQPKPEDKPAIAQPVRQDPVGPDQALALEGNAVIWIDAELRLDATDKSTKVALAPLAAPRKNKLNHVVPVRVVGTSGDYVEVELSAATDCTWAVVRVDSRLEKLRLLVKRADLAPVVARKFGKTHRDGSRITLAPGVPVVPSANGFIISINGDDIELAIPAASIGHSYAPPKQPRAERKPKKMYSLDTTTTVKLLGETVQLSESANSTAEKIERRKQTVLFPISAACIDAKVVVPKKAVELQQYGYGTGFGTGAAGVNRLAQERWYLPKGTALTSAGRTVAILKHEIEIAMPADAATTSCHEFSIELDQTNNNMAPLVKKRDKVPLQLCAPIASVVHEKPNRY